MTVLHLTAQIWTEGDAYMVRCPELEVTSQGDSFAHALEMIKEAVTVTLADLTPEELAGQLQPVAFVPFEVELPRG